MPPDPSMLSKKERVGLILKALQEAAPVEHREAALALMDRVFRQIEDAHSGVLHEPHSQERLYPPVASMEKQVAGKPGLRRYRHTNHYTLIADNGAIMIRTFVRERRDGVWTVVGEETVFEKPGADGRCTADFE